MYHLIMQDVTHIPHYNICIYVCCTFCVSVLLTIISFATRELSHNCKRGKQTGKLPTTGSIETPPQKAGCATSQISSTFVFLHSPRWGRDVRSYVLYMMPASCEHRYSPQSSRNNHSAPNGQKTNMHTTLKVF